MAGMALGNIDLRFAWQAWRLMTSTFALRGRRGTYGTGLALVARLGLAGAAGLCVAGMALGNIDLTFAWQAWRLWLYTPLNKLLSPTTLLHGTLSHSSLQYAFLAHTDPPPYLVSFLPFSSHLHLSLATCWKKLTCGVIRSFNSSKNESKRTKPRTPVPGRIIANIMVLGTL